MLFLEEAGLGDRLCRALITMVCVVHGANSYSRWTPISDQMCEQTSRHCDKQARSSPNKPVAAPDPDCRRNSFKEDGLLSGGEFVSAFLREEEQAEHGVKEDELATKRKAPKKRQKDFGEKAPKKRKTIACTVYHNYHLIITITDNA